MKETLREIVDSRGQKMGIHRSEGIVRGVKILGNESRNGRTYLPQAIRDAASLYEEAKVNVNHDPTQRVSARDYRDRIGVIRNVTVRDGEGLFADFHFNPKHALAEQFLWDAEHAPENVGFSHNVIARTSREGERLVVEKILKVQSVDLVADPATTNGLFEAVDTSQEPVEEVEKTQSSALCEAIEARDRLQEERDHLREACDRLQKAFDELQEKLSRQKRLVVIERLFAEAGLPLPGSDNPLAELVSGNAFVESLVALEEEQAVREQIYRRADLLKRIGPTGTPGPLRPLSRERTSFALPEVPESAESFINAITF